MNRPAELWIPFGWLYQIPGNGEAVEAWRRRANQARREIRTWAKFQVGAERARALAKDKPFLRRQAEALAESLDRHARRARSRARFYRQAADFEVYDHQDSAWIAYCDRDLDTRPLRAEEVLGCR